MSLLDWTKPKKVRSTEKHNAIYSSDSGVEGTYVPNMSDEDMHTWKAKKIGGEDPRVEIRKTISFNEPSKTHAAGVGHSTQILIVVRADPNRRARISMNGPALFGAWDWASMSTAIEEAVGALSESKD
jgi:hypothetical protein